MNGSSESNTDRERSGAGSQSPLLLVPMDDTISVQNIRNYLIFNGGKVKHAEIVSFFKRPLTDPVLKGNKPVLTLLTNRSAVVGLFFSLVDAVKAKAPLTQREIPYL